MRLVLDKHPFAGVSLVRVDIEEVMPGADSCLLRALVWCGATFSVVEVAGPGPASIAARKHVASVLRENQARRFHPISEEKH